MVASTKHGAYRDVGLGTAWHVAIPLAKTIGLLQRMPVCFVVNVR